jgi:DNA-binding NarL/FixJ family response regulator
MQPALEGVVRLAAAAVPCLNSVSSTDPSGSTPVLQHGQICIAVADLSDGPGSEDLRGVAQSDPDVRIVVLGDQVEPSQALDLIRVGISAFVRTPDSLVDLPQTLVRVARGERVPSAPVERLALQELSRSVQRARRSSGMEPSITAREQEVLELLAEGFTMHQIGRRLGISPRTAEAHVAKLYPQADRPNEVAGHRPGVFAWPDRTARVQLSGGLMRPIHG